jgi:hypothetical protein
MASGQRNGDVRAKSRDVPMATFVRPYAETQNDTVAKHRKPGPAVTRPALPARPASRALIRAYELVTAEGASDGEIGCACEVITEHSLTEDA